MIAILTVSFFQAHKEYRKEMKNLFKDKEYDLKEKRFVINEALGYLANINNMTINEMRIVINHMKNSNKGEM